MKILLYYCIVPLARIEAIILLAFILDVTVQWLSAFSTSFPSALILLYIFRVLGFYKATASRDKIYFYDIVGILQVLNRKSLRHQYEHVCMFFKIEVNICQINNIS
jgi:hypothetical protein